MLIKKIEEERDAVQCVRFLIAILCTLSADDLQVHKTVLIYSCVKMISLFGTCYELMLEQDFGWFNRWFVRFSLG